MKLVKFINNKFKKFCQNSDFTFYGQNISTGSCLGGLLREITSKRKFNIINTPNSENTLVGFGFGMLIGGENSSFFVKQQDFILLSVDQLKNTYGMIKNRKFTSAFNIITTITDTGYEGSQSNLHNSYDLSTFLQCKIYDISNKYESDYLFKSILKKPGFKIINFSNKLLRKDLDLEIYKCKPKVIKDSIIQYYSGEDLTIFCNSFALNNALKIKNYFKEKKINAAIFSLFGYHFENLDLIIQNINKTKKLIIIDDTLSNNNFSDKLIFKLMQRNIKISKLKLIKNKTNKKYTKPTYNKLSINYNDLYRYFLND